MRGQHKCMVVVENKSEEPIIVTPDYFKESYQEIGVAHGASITLYETKNLPGFDSDGDEGGEEEHEEMEEERDEMEDKNDDDKVDEEESDENKKASEVLFENEGDKKTSKQDDKWTENNYSTLIAIRWMSKFNVYPFKFNWIQLNFASDTLSRDYYNIFHQF